MSTIEIYEDPIISIANDPDLNRVKSKTNRIIEIIHSFALVERKVSKLCQLSLTILQALEKIELNLKNWAFLSLDINSNNHFQQGETSNLKSFNNSISLKVLVDCKDINRKLTKISIDLDYITKASRTLTPLEYISDSGTLLTSLSLRNIKLKYELTDKLTVAYSKAKLITIGTELEQMLLEDNNDTDVQTVSTYKTFVANLLKQLNTAIEEEDNADKTECLAVINDMEKMFDAFKLEKVQQAQEQFKQIEDEFEPTPVQTPVQQQSEQFVNIHRKGQFPNLKHFDMDDDDESYDSDMGSSMFGSTYNSPLVHSITKSSPSKAKLDFSLGTELHKTTLSEEMPYLLSAFNAAKAVEEDIMNFTHEKPTTKPTTKPKKHSPLSSVESVNEEHSIHFPKSNLPDTPLTSESTILNEYKPSPYSLYANNSLLSRLGIRPQVITTEVPKELALNTSTNVQKQNNKSLKTIENNEDKENSLEPLTQNNLHNHNISSLRITNDFNDQVE